MRIDQIKKAAIDRTSTTIVQYTMIRGRFCELLFINTATWHNRDIITIKLRSEAGNLTLVDRVPALALATLCDMKKGLTTTGTPDYVGEEDGSNSGNGGFVNINQGIHFYQNAFTLPMGHITLTGTAVVEITVECCADPGHAKGEVKISTVQRKTRADVLLCYDLSNELEENFTNVRELYLLGKKNHSFFDNDPDAAKATYGLPKAKDINVKLEVDGDDSENELEAYGAITAIDGELTYPSSSLVRIFQDFESVPANIYIKVTGDDADMAQLLLVRETQVPHMVAASLVAAVDKEQKRVEVLEQNQPEKAKALRQTGQIASSAELAVAKENFVPAVPVPVKS